MFFIKQSMVVVSINPNPLTLTPMQIINIIMVITALTDVNNGSLMYPYCKVPMPFLLRSPAAFIRTS